MFSSVYASFVWCFLIKVVSTRTAITFVYELRLSDKLVQSKAHLGAHILLHVVCMYI